MDPLRHARDHQQPGFVGQRAPPGGKRVCSQRAVLDAMRTEGFNLDGKAA